jgi:hypothetical protein
MKVTALNLDSPEIKNCLKQLKEIDFELAYLAVLTREGLKPLSRWEKPLDDHSIGLLQQMGLLTRQIRRTVKTGKEIVETIFSVSAGYIQLYEKRFGDAPVDKSAATVHFEGFLFGYPPCCVDEYIRHSYIKNVLTPEQQRILFHWACKDCKITPLLLPAYKSVYNFLNKEMADGR